ncbi:MAG: hypothetical protein WCA49_09145 [Candidatus Sulfotelmatobacter sp.]
MSDFVQWIAAQAEANDALQGILGKPLRAQVEERRSGKFSSTSSSWQDLPTHNFPAQKADFDEGRPETALDRNPDLWLYRERTVGLLRRYMRLSLEAGRLPSVVGREFFRAKITAYKATTFEERVIFVHDVEGCLERLAPFDQRIIARLVLQGHDHERAARLLHSTRKTIERRLPELLDELSEEFLRVRLLAPLPEGERPGAE